MQTGANEAPDLSFIDHAALKRARCAPPHISLRARVALGDSIRCGVHFIKGTSREEKHAIQELIAIRCDVLYVLDSETWRVFPGKEAAAIFDTARLGRAPTALEMDLRDVLISVYCRCNFRGDPRHPFAPAGGLHPMDVAAILRPYGYDLADRGSGVVLIGLRNDRGEPMRVMRDRVVLRDRLPAKEYFWPY